VPGQPEAARVQVPPPVIEGLVLSMPFLQGTDRSLLQGALPHILCFEAKPGAWLLRSGSLGGLSLLVGGAAKLLPGADLTATPLEAMRAPDFFGEAGVLSGQPQPYSAVAAEDCRLFWLAPDVARALLMRMPAFGHAAARRLADRLVLACSRDLGRAPSADDTGLFDSPHAEAPPATDPGGGDARVRFAEVNDYQPQPSVLSMIPARMIRQQRALPLALAGRRLTVGMVAPRDPAARAELQRVLQAIDLEIVAISADDFAQNVARLKLDEQRPAKGGKGHIVAPDTLVFENVVDGGDAVRGEAKGSGEDVLKLVSRVVATAVEMGASDIHLEPAAVGVRVRYRVNGTMQDSAEAVRPELARGVTARLKVLAGMDITERRRPQDGRISVRVGPRELDLRVNCMPASRGEKVCMRLLEGAGSTRPLQQIFVDPQMLSMVRKALNRPYGGIIVAGATGAGKTSTLYAMLNERRTTRPDTNILTVADPVEYRLSGVTQVQVDHNIELGFARVLRAMLRQDPDVIVVGETRDSETALMALEAAMTGHLLLTSLHANNSLTCIQRLENLGCGRPLISQSVALMLVQRLVPRLCEACRRMEEPPRALFDALVARRVVDIQSGTALPAPGACDACNQTGYVGRVAVIEGLLVNDSVRHALAAGRSLGEIEQLAREAKVLVPFHQAASNLIKAQLISGAEALLTVAD